MCVIHDYLFPWRFLGTVMNVRDVSLNQPTSVSFISPKVLEAKTRRKVKEEAPRSRSSHSA